MSESALLATHFFVQGSILTLMRGAAARGLDPFATTWSIAMATSLIGGGVLFLTAPAATLALLTGPTAVASCLFAFAVLGGAFVASSYGRMLAQRHLPSYVEGPLSRFNLLIVVMLATLALGERRSLVQLFGIGLAFLPLVLIHVRARGKANAGEGARWAGIIWLALSTLCSAGVQLSAKLALDPRFGIGLPPLSFVVGTNIFTALLSAAVCLGTTLAHPGKVAGTLRNTLLLGGVVGTLNAISFSSQSLYLVGGDASVLFPVSSMSIVVPMAYGLLRKQEAAPDRMQLVAIAVALSAVLLLVT